MGPFSESSQNVVTGQITEIWGNFPKVTWKFLKLWKIVRHYAKFAENIHFTCNLSSIRMVNINRLEFVVREEAP